MAREAPIIRLSLEESLRLQQLWGLGSGVAVTPLTAAVLAAVSDADLGEASAINDAASRVGGVIAIVPALIGASGGRSLAGALAHGYQPARARLPARDDRHWRPLRRRRTRHRGVRLR